MQKSYFVNPVEFAVAMCTAVVAAVIACCLIYISRPVSALVFFGISLLFFKVSATTGAKITIDPETITRSLFGRVTESFRWDEVVEVGVAGSRIFPKGNPNKSGALYIYFSKTELTDDERFQMMLNWPPKDKLYLAHDKDRMDFIQVLYGKKIQKYNTGSTKV